MWCAEVVELLQKDYPEIKLGIIYPFQGFGENWNEANQQMLQRVQMSADYVNATSHQPYKRTKPIKKSYPVSIGTHRWCVAAL